MNTVPLTIFGGTVVEAFALMVVVDSVTGRTLAVVVAPSVAAVALVELGEPAVVDDFVTEAFVDFTVVFVDFSVVFDDFSVVFVDFLVVAVTAFAAGVRPNCPKPIELTTNTTAAATATRRCTCADAAAGVVEL